MSEVISIIAQASAAVTAFAALAGVVVTAVRWFDRQKKQDEEINKIKRENMLIVYALSACLDGLTQLGANHSVTSAKEKLDRYIIEQAHGQMRESGK